MSTIILFIMIILFLFTELDHNVFKMLYICVGMPFLNQAGFKKKKEFNQQHPNCLCKIHQEYNVFYPYDMNQTIN